MDDINLSNIPRNKYCAIHKPNDEILLFTNDDIKFWWIIKEIASKHLEGYYIMFEGNKYNINSNGHIENRPEGLFDIYENLYNEVLSYTLYDIEPIEIDEYLIDRNVEYEQVIRPNGEIIN